MAAQIYTLNLDGYWREPNIGGLPPVSGIYCAYACVNNPAAGSLSIRRLLYIGESEDVRSRVAGHERWPDWRNQLIRGEEICLSAAPIWPATDRQRVEAAMIFHHKPPCNVEYVHLFPFNATTIMTWGTNAKLDPFFTIEPSPTLGTYGRW